MNRPNSWGGVWGLGGNRGWGRGLLEFLVLKGGVVGRAEGGGCCLIEGRGEI